MLTQYSIVWVILKFRFSIKFTNVFLFFWYFMYLELCFVIMQILYCTEQCNWMRLQIGNYKSQNNLPLKIKFRAYVPRQVWSNSAAEGGKFCFSLFANTDWHSARCQHDRNGTNQACTGASSEWIAFVVHSMFLHEVKYEDMKLKLRKVWKINGRILFPTVQCRLSA